MIEDAIDNRVITDIYFSSFPRGCCGDTCDLLGQYLLDHGIKTWNISGTYYSNYDEKIGTYIDSQSHAWLAMDNPQYTNDYIIIDITGDQFDDRDSCGRYDIPVYVGKMDEFHGLFTINGYEVFDFGGIDSYIGPTSARLIRLYREIVGE